MRGAYLVLAVAVLLVASPGVQSVSSDVARPSAAMAYAQPGGAYVTWTPTVEAADGYVIYGVHARGLDILATVSGDFLGTTVAGVYPEYAVASLEGVRLSPPTRALTLTSLCVLVELTPPAVSVGCTKLLTFRSPLP